MLPSSGPAPRERPGPSDSLQDLQGADIVRLRRPAGRGQSTSRVTTLGAAHPLDPDAKCAPHFRPRG